MSHVLFFLFIGLIIFSIIFIMFINENNDKEHTKYRGTDVFYDTDLEKHRKIIKLQRKLLLKKQISLFLKKGFRK